MESSQNRSRYQPVFSSDPTPDSSFNEGGDKNKEPITDLDAMELTGEVSDRDGRPTSLDIFSDISNIEQDPALQQHKVTDLDADSDTDRSDRYKVTTSASNSAKDSKTSASDKRSSMSMPTCAKAENEHVQAPPRKSHKLSTSTAKSSSDNSADLTQTEQHKPADILLTSEGISLSTESELSDEASEDETMSASISESTQSAHSSKIRTSTGSLTPTTTRENQVSIFEG